MEQPDFDTFMDNLRARFAKSEEMRERLVEKLLEMGKGEMAVVDQVEFRAPATEDIPDPAADGER
jgi:hypothetical protein